MHKKLINETKNREQYEELERVTFEAPAALKKAFHLKVRANDQTIKEVLCELMENYVNNGKKGTKLN